MDNWAGCKCGTWSDKYQEHWDGDYGYGSPNFIEFCHAISILLTSLNSPKRLGAFSLRVAPNFS